MIISRKKYEETIAKAKEEAAYEATRKTEERVWVNERFGGLQDQIDRLGQTVNELAEAVNGKGRRKCRLFRGM
jgi:phosphoenolpyruvate carboxylase